MGVGACVARKPVQAAGGWRVQAPGPAGPIRCWCCVLRNCLHTVFCFSAPATLCLPRAASGAARVADSNSKVLVLGIRGQHKPNVIRGQSTQQSKESYASYPALSNSNPPPHRERTGAGLPITNIGADYRVNSNPRRGGPYQGTTQPKEPHYAARRHARLQWPAHTQELPVRGRGSTRSLAERIYPYPIPPSAT